MKQFRPGFIAILVCCTLFATEINSEHPAVTFSATLSTKDTNPQFDKMAYILGNSYVPKGVSQVLQASHEKYLEGCDLMQAGESEKARIFFNEAVDLLLSPNWDMTSTLHLNHFFQEMIQRIPKDQFLYYSDSEDSSARDLIPLTISPSLKDELIFHLGGTSYEIPITINKTVAKSLYYWLNDGRRFFIEGLLRSGQYRPIIERIFREENVPLDLMYLAQVESLFKPTAFSKARAKGIWQFNKSTAIQYGLKVTRDVDERSDPEKSTRAAARYLKDLYNTFGDWNLVLAAYNWGGARVKRLVQNTGIDDFWELVHTGQKLPKETKNHIPLIHASIILARNPEKFGLPLQLDAPLEYVEVSVSKAIDLRAAAEVLNTTVEELKHLNPSLRNLRTPAKYPDYRLKVPADSDVNLRERLVALSVMIEPSL
ncbi:MAG: lytic transglycosylase domain-containing protein [Acidobacteria bacterium]|nr:lytic transglycosylase domain-containing protein [Acidobacteriota bacterium]